MKTLTVEEMKRQIEELERREEMRIASLPNWIGILAQTAFWVKKYVVTPFMFLYFYCAQWLANRRQQNKGDSE